MITVRCFKVFIIKLFSDSLRAYFESFGEVRDVDIKIDQATGSSRGFGFVLFADKASIDGVEKQRNHSLGEFES